MLQRWPVQPGAGQAPGQQRLRGPPPLYFEKRLWGLAHPLASGSRPCHFLPWAQRQRAPYSSNGVEEDGALTLPLTVSRDRVTGGRWSDFSSICQPITVMLPTRSLSADLQQATCSRKWCHDCVSLSSHLGVLGMPGSGQLDGWAAFAVSPGSGRGTQEVMGTEREQNSMEKCAHVW